MFVSHLGKSIMVKLMKTQCVLLLTALIVNVSLENPLRAAIKIENEVPLSQIKNRYLSLSLSNVVNIFRRKKPPKGGRGPMCLIVPQRLDDPVYKAEGSQEIWGMNPVFLWHLKSGNVRGIELFNKGSNEVIWSREIPEGKTSVVYDGKPLKPGNSYEWRIIANAPFRMKSIPAEFEVMEPQKRSSIAIGLKQKEQQLRKEGANAEKIAMEKAKYFAKEQLWSDVVREIYTVKNPSAKLKQIMQQIPSSDYCDSNTKSLSISSSE